MNVAQLRRGRTAETAANEMVPALFFPLPTLTPAF